MLTIPDKNEIRHIARKRRREIPADERGRMDAAIYKNLIHVLKAVGMPENIYTYVSTPEESDTKRLIGACLNAVSCNAEMNQDIVPGHDIVPGCGAAQGNNTAPGCDAAQGYGSLSVFCALSHTPIRVAVPRVIGRRMDFFYITNMDDLEPGYIGIYEPKDHCVKTDVHTGGNGSASNAAAIIPGLAFTKDRKRCGYGGGYYDRFLSENPGLIKIAICYSVQIFDDFETDEHDIKPDYIVTDKRVYY